MIFAVVYLYLLGAVLMYTIMTYIATQENDVPFTGIASKTLMAVSWPISFLMILTIGFTLIVDEKVK